MEAPVSPLVLSRAISQAVNEMHDAQPSERLKQIDPDLYHALQEILASAKAFYAGQVITPEMAKKASRCTGQIIPLN